jgi:hypothetical protein
MNPDMVILDKAFPLDGSPAEQAGGAQGVDSFFGCGRVGALR